MTSDLERLLARRGASHSLDNGILRIRYGRHTLAIAEHPAGLQPSARQQKALSYAARTGAITAAITSVDELERLFDRIDRRRAA